MSGKSTKAKKAVRVVLITTACIFAVITALTGACVVAAVKSQKSYVEDQLKMPKTDEELIGQCFIVPRGNKDPVEVNLYIPESGQKTPVVFNLHGGAFVGGHADTLDTQSDRISKNWNAAVVTVNYKLAKDGITIEYGTEEIVDTIKYFKEHADEYNIDTNKLIVMGYSAGGYHALKAALDLKAENIDMAAQVLCYPFIRDAVELYDTLSDEQKSTLAPALFVLADGDPIGDGSLAYEELLRNNGVKTLIKKYSGTSHGFLEENNPEYESLQNKPSKSPEQEKAAREAEDFIYNWINNIE